MLDRGFENDIRTIIGHTAPAEQRQTVMCTFRILSRQVGGIDLTLRAVSATWPEAVRRLAASFQRNPVRVTVGSDDLTANSRVQQGERTHQMIRYAFLIVNHGQPWKCLTMYARKSKSAKHID